MAESSGPQPWLARSAQRCVACNRHGRAEPEGQTDTSKLLTGHHGQWGGGRGGEVLINGPGNGNDIQIKHYSTLFLENTECIVTNRVCVKGKSLDIKKLTV